MRSVLRMLESVVALLRGVCPRGAEPVVSGG
jgi:hypothetical protein